MLATTNCHHSTLLYLTYGLSSASMMLKQDATRALSTVVTGSFRSLRTKWTASGTMSCHSLPSSSLPSAAPAQLSYDWWYGKVSMLRHWQNLISVTSKLLHKRRDATPL